jgi:DNA-binding NtrC family response regulator
MSASTPSTRRKILLIDDDELIAGSLREYLAVRGCEVDAAADAVAAEGLMAAGTYDVVLVDPYLTGGVRYPNAELLERVCALQPRASMIVLTAYTSPALARTAAGCGATAVLSKPQSILNLERLIRGTSGAAAPIAYEQHIPEPAP